MAQIKVADYIFRRLADWGVRHVFLVTGGGAMHLNDALGQETRIHYICNHHEQASAMAAEGYARVSGGLGVVCVTTGPGGTNALTGVLGQWLDSIPTLYLSGQVRWDCTAMSTGLPLRQLGDQEANITVIASSITKYAETIVDPLRIRYCLEKAIHLAHAGRPGPVWLDIPLNVQAAMVEEDALVGYTPEPEVPVRDRTLLETQVDELIRRLRTAERPVLLAGAGVRLAGAYPLLQQVVERLNIPVLVAWDAIDLMATDHALYFGRPSTLGQRAGNFIFQNADLLFSVGCRLNLRQIGYTYPSVARAAYKIVVDIDPLELQKPTIHPDLPIACDAKQLLTMLNAQLGSDLPPKVDWIAWCAERRRRYPPVTPAMQLPNEPVNPYVFCEALSDLLDEHDVIVSSNGASCVVPIQALRMRAGQRHIVNSGCAAMGYGLPSAMGACFAHGRRVICLEGDGSIQMNIQELQTVVHHRLPLKIFLFNNGGYQSIRSTQRNFFAGRLVGESAQSGVSFPDMVRIAEAYGIPAMRITRHDEMKAVIQEALVSDGPVLVDVGMDPEIMFAPRVTSQRLPDGRMVSKPLEEMFPFLEQEEFLANMLISPWEPV